MMVGYQRHVNPAYVETRDAVLDGEIAPKIVTAELTQDWIQNVAGTWRVDPDMSGGGQLYDSGSHLLRRHHLANRRGPHPRHRGHGVRRRSTAGGRPGGTHSPICRRYGGEHRRLRDAPDISERITVRGDGGHAILEGTGWGPREATIRAPDGTVRSSAAGDLSSYDKVDAFVQSVRNGETPPATAENAFYATALTEAAYESARTGESVAVETDLSATEQSTPEQ